MGSNLIAELRAELAPADLSGLDWAEAEVRLPRMDVEAAQSAFVIGTATLDEFVVGGAIAHSEGRVALERERERRLDLGESGRPLGAAQFLQPPLDQFAAKWDGRRAEIERTKGRLPAIRYELQRRFDRGEMAQRVATLFKEMRTAAHEAVLPEKKTCKSCGAVTVIGDQFEPRQKAEALRVRISKEYGITVRASLAELAKQA